MHSSRTTKERLETLQDLLRDQLSLVAHLQARLLSNLEAIRSHVVDTNSPSPMAWHQLFPQAWVLCLHPDIPPEYAVVVPQLGGAPEDGVGR